MNKEQVISDAFAAYNSETSTIRPKVLFILHLPPPIHGPAVVGGYIKNSKLINEAFDVDYLSLQTSRTLTQIGKGGLSKILVTIGLYLRVFSTLLRNRYDYCYLSINAHGPAFYKEMIVVFLLRLFRLKTVYYYHMKGVARFQDKRLPDLLYRYQFAKSRTILLSPLVYWDVEKYVPKDEVFYCIEGIPDNLGKSLEEMRAARLAKARPELLFLSNLMKAKGVFVLLEACKILNERGVDFGVTFIGGPSDISAEDLNAFIANNGLDGKVNYVGPKYGKDKIEFFERVDLFVHPTLNDVLPLTILEALQYGLPVISTNEGAIAEMVEDGVTGYIVPKNDPEVLADRIGPLLENTDLRLKLSRNARERFEERFTLQKFEENFVRALNSAINSFADEHQ